MVGCCRQSKLIYTDIIYITLSYNRTLYKEVVYTNCFAGSLNTYIGKTLVPDSSVPFSHPSINGKLYYNGGLFLNKSIDLTSISSYKYYLC